MVDVLHTPLVNLTGSNACPYVTACPETVKAAFKKENDVFAENHVKYVNPVLNLQDRKLFAHQMFTAFQPLLGLSPEENQRAIEAGYKALEEYETGMRRKARDVLHQLEPEHRIAILMLSP